MPRALLVLVSSLVTLLLAELVLQLMTPPEQFLSPADEDFWRARLQDRLDRGQTEGEFGDTVYDARLGWRMRPDFEGDGITHNSKGYRGNREYAVPAPGPRILGIGDSYTYGLGVGDDETFLAVVEAELGIETINAGVNGFGVDQALLLWESEGKLLEPNAVILGYFAEDFHRHVAAVRERPKPVFLPASRGRFELSGVPVTPLSGSYDAAAPWLRVRLADAFVRIGERAGRRFSGIDGAWLERRGAVSRYLIARAHDTVTASGVELVVVFMGHCHDGDPAYAWLERELVAQTNALGVTLVNLASAMRVPGRERFYGGNCHYSVAGNRYAGRAIADTLRELDVVPR